MEVNEFFETNYTSLRRYCRSRWNGMGEDVLHQAYIIAAERYEHVNFSLFLKICDESARNQDVYRYTYDHEHTIILPPTPKAAERLVQQVEEDEHIKKITRMAKKMAREHREGQMCLFLAGLVGQEVRG